MIQQMPTLAHMWYAMLLCAVCGYYIGYCMAVDEDVRTGEDGHMRAVDGAHRGCTHTDPGGRHARVYVYTCICVHVCACGWHDSDLVWIIWASNLEKMGQYTHRSQSFLNLRHANRVTIERNSLI